MSEEDAEWRRYEKTATVILDEMASHFGLVRVEGEQSVQGRRSGTEWRIEAKGVVEGEHAFVIIECRRYTTSKLKQEAMGALAYRVADTGATGAIVVSPCEPQEGAKKIAAAEKITTVELNADATPQEFAMKFLGNLFLRPRGATCQAAAGRVTVVCHPAYSD